jgi:hypothetical protein
VNRRVSPSAFRASNAGSTSTVATVGAGGCVDPPSPPEDNTWGKRREASGQMQLQGSLAPARRKRAGHHTDAATCSLGRNTRCPTSGSAPTWRAGYDRISESPRTA